MVMLQKKDKEKENRKEIVIKEVDVVFIVHLITFLKELFYEAMVINHTSYCWIQIYHSLSRIIVKLRLLIYIKLCQLIAS